ncbi:ABC-type branched-chain amino acid transport system ATP-binding protein [Alloalcanivorax dieselolei B5]|uniref:High-affinity branched-chain amino acid transport ATP-binding protein n=1 Tax=Alcanivorax dieselolei (strain DSM 16502 / CGMCC 1.3690 / MCCC 1A00001 / B-5) TaxID=930169 RepID=K0CJV9_ALCDB|nr:ABC transporter ATP-binding protein [Alloalcanivorax dieselolei]AFT72670.1 ABC-type branched-chain amino acid transport system ATP-binding protein [Alloalcanivorax dieselolei B5]GGJ79626.1 ABC transporter ATP-binding protein [Alloalcanivorax dieselolei]
MLKLDDITVHYGATVAVDKVSLEVNAGEFVTLIGSNGAGKSSTLRAISGLEPVVSGTITFEGKPITNTRPQRIIEHGIAHCPEGRRVFSQLNVRENLEMGAYCRSDHADIRDDLESMLDRFPRLRERIEQPAGTLSGGEQQMLAIARALMSRPRLVMFDEPSLGLAPNFVEQVFELTAEIRAGGTTVLMVEQNAYAALELCDRSYLLETGRVVLQGTAREMRDNPDIRKAYLGG